MLEELFNKLEQFAAANPTLRFTINRGDSDGDDDGDVANDGKQSDVVPDDEQELGEGMDGHDQSLYDLVASVDIPAEHSPETQTVN